MSFKQDLLKYLSNKVIIKYAILGAVALSLIDGLWNLLLQTNISIFSSVIEWFLFFLIFGALASVPQKIKLVVVGTLVSFPAVLFSLVLAILVAMLSGSFFTVFRFTFPLFLSLSPVFVLTFLGGYFVFALIQGAFFGLLSNKGKKFVTQFAFLNGLAFIFGIILFGLNEQNPLYTFWTDYPPSFGIIVFGDMLPFMVMGFIRGFILGGLIGHMRSSQIKSS